MWYYEDNEVNEAPEEYVGFVYRITDKFNGKKYIGLKTFWSKRTLPPLKGQKRKRKKIVESDWKNYYGSNEEVKALVEEHGPDRFKREILHFGKTKGELNYLELYEQVTRNVLFRDDYYNGIINARVHKRHVANIKDIFSSES